MRRAAVCIGVDRAEGMTPLRAAAQGARDFAAWANAQGCDSTLLVHDAADPSTGPVSLNQVFEAIKKYVTTHVYDQLIIYFSGHGILSAPGTEYWLLSGAPENPNEAINLLRSVQDARNSLIPHVIFVSDACRSSVAGPPLSGIVGGVAFPNMRFSQKPAEVDVFYATLPGDPAYEVPEREAVDRYSGIFTSSLLNAVTVPTNDLIDTVQDGRARIAVITSRRLKLLLESLVPNAATAVDVRLRQKPELRVETALPRFFAIVGDVKQRRNLRGGVTQPPPTASPTIGMALDALRASVEGRTRAGLLRTEFDDLDEIQPSEGAILARDLGLGTEVNRLVWARAHSHFEMDTGFSVHGTEGHGNDVVVRGSPGWLSDPPLRGESTTFGQVLHIRLRPIPDTTPDGSSLVLDFGGATGSVLAVLPGFVGVVVVRDGRVASVNYVPSQRSPRFAEYALHESAIEVMKAVATVAARNGIFEVVDAPADFARTIRQAKGVDPVLGLYAAYAYAQTGRVDDVLSVLGYMLEDEIPIPFDVALLAGRADQQWNDRQEARFAPFAPMLTQGWSLLAADHPLYRPIHGRLRGHLLPALWLTLTAEGVSIAAQALVDQEVR